MLPLKKNTTSYYNIGQLRVDYWNKLKTETSELTRTLKDSENENNHQQKSGKLLEELSGVECFFSFPGMHRIKKMQSLLKIGDYIMLSQMVVEATKNLMSEQLSHKNGNDFDDLNTDTNEGIEQYNNIKKNHFEVLFVDDFSEAEEATLKQNFRSLRASNDSFSYDIVVQKSFQDALINLHFNHNIQAVVVRYGPAYESQKATPLIEPYIQPINKLDYSNIPENQMGPLIGEWIKENRPELDAYYVTDTPLSLLKDSTLKGFSRIFYQTEDNQELHLTILRGLAERFETPFFSALVEYSKKPTGVFHAMPISRGNSVFKSKWIRDFGEFYGRNMFLAETSATTGGLDSLLQPTGPLKKAQEMASQAYGSKHTYFVTNGTSTANKIVMQALVKPKDVVLIDRDCHKSHHYGLVLAGAFPVYLDSYPIEAFSMYGAVPTEQIISKLIQQKEAGRLNSVKMVLLTNCSFDGLVYNVERVMERVLAIKPDMIFLWDEAWFAFAGFANSYRQRTGMFVAQKLYHKYKSTEYRTLYNDHITNLKKGEIPKLPDPQKVKIRVYATQSTHKTLSSFRQGSMIHIWDEDFRRKSEATFLEAYMTHTSTSPNYQMLASLDVGRRQVQLEGFKLVERSIEMAMALRAKINDHPRLKKYFDVLTVHDFIPEQYRQTGLREYYTSSAGWNRMEEAWEEDDFVLDPTKITLSVGKTGIDGDTFKNKYLMDKFNIQVNKTSRNSVLLMTSIGTTKGSITYLINALLKISDELDEEFKALNVTENKIHLNRIHSLTREVPPLPDFSYFHHSFQAIPGLPGGDLREAYFLAYDEENFEYIPLAECLNVMGKGKTLVSSSFVIPYPPGFPVLVPGQVVSEGIINFLNALDVSEIHGYRPDLGLSFFTEAVLNRKKTIAPVKIIENNVKQLK